VTNALYYGDNLNVLRDSIASDSIDLVYLDPPFNSSANYNVLFKAPGGEHSKAQIEAFEDTWHWNEHAELAFDQVMQSGNTDAANILKAMRSALGENDVMAYLAMMAVRLIELHRVLKPTGSLYLHCDPTASHYLKIILDAVFEPTNFGMRLSGDDIDVRRGLSTKRVTTATQPIRSSSIPRVTSISFTSTESERLSMTKQQSQRCIRTKMSMDAI
jgi:hypothetical protein